MTAAEVLSEADLPAFPRSTMDGYSVRSADTFGATESLPAFLDVVGEVPMGAPPSVSLTCGDRARRTGLHGRHARRRRGRRRDGRAHPGGRRPVASRCSGPSRLARTSTQVGEDIRAGGVVLPAGHEVRPQDVGGLMTLGIDSVSVARRPRVAIVSTGDELVPPESTPGPGQVRDVNTYTLSALVEGAGGVPVRAGLVPDEFEEQCAAAVDGPGPLGHARLLGRKLGQR